MSFLWIFRTGLGCSRSSAHRNGRHKTLSGL